MQTDQPLITKTTELMLSSRRRWGIVGLLCLGMAFAWDFTDPLEGDVGQTAEQLGMGAPATTAADVAAALVGLAKVCATTEPVATAVHVTPELMDELKLMAGEEEALQWADGNAPPAMHGIPVHHDLERGSVPAYRFDYAPADAGAGPAAPVEAGP